MSSEAPVPHSCEICSSLLFSHSSGQGHEGVQAIGDYGQKVFLFPLHMDEAILGAERGCAFMNWLISLPTGWRGQLRAALSEVGHGVTNLIFEWVNEVDDSVLGANDELTVTAHERYET
jgi:hypothetical protein